MDIILNYDDDCDDYDDREVGGGEDGEVFEIARVQRPVKEFRTRSFSERIANEMGLKAGGGASKRHPGSSATSPSQICIVENPQLPTIPTPGDDTAVDGDKGCGDSERGTTQTLLPQAGTRVPQPGLAIQTQPENTTKNSVSQLSQTIPGANTVPGKGEMMPNLPAKPSFSNIPASPTMANLPSRPAARVGSDLMVLLPPRRQQALSRRQAPGVPTRVSTDRYRPAQSLTAPHRYAPRGDGEVTKMGAGESYRPSVRPRSPRSDTSRFDNRDRDRSPRRERPRSPQTSDAYIPGGRDRSPLRRRSRSPGRGLHLTTVAHYELDHLSQEDLHQQDQGEVDGVQGLVAHRAVTTASQLPKRRSLGDDHDRHHLLEIDLQGETLNTAHVAHHQDLATAQRHLWMTFRGRSPVRLAQPFRAPTGPSANRNFSAPMRSPSASGQSTPLSMPAPSRPEGTAAVAPPSGPRNFNPPPARGGFLPRGGRGSFSDRRPEPGWGGVHNNRPPPVQSPTLPATTLSATPAIPTGPRASSSGSDWKTAPPSRSSSISSAPFHGHNTKTFTPSLPRVHPAIANLPPIIPGGKIDATYSPVPKELEARIRKTDEDLERMREDLNAKEEKLRKGLAQWDRLARESASMGLKAELSERHVRMLAGEGVGGAAF
ncbi:hypothetical protein VE02_05195 [Pseudogymnoascus sp. 03VT05]|nr:hypothetical protein VE02_05195 [Pseudogymnoascus sp. 03VT05]